MVKPSDRNTQATSGNIDSSRRTFLIAIIGLAALAIPSRDWISRLTSIDPIEGLLRRIRGTSGAGAIAESWVARAAAPVSYTELRTALIRDIGPSGERLSVMIASDFAAGRMLLQDGWPVAETEARLCALAQLAKA